MADSIMTVEIRVSWWLYPYIWLLCCLCWVFGTEPDEDKLTKMVLRGIKPVVKRG